MRNEFSLYIFLIVLSLIVGACNIEVGKIPVDTPPKPNNVPAEAIWSGGPDGGVFLSVSKKAGDASGVCLV